MHPKRLNDVHTLLHKSQNRGGLHEKRRKLWRSLQTFTISHILVISVFLVVPQSPDLSRRRPERSRGSNIVWLVYSSAVSVLGFISEYLDNGGCRPPRC